MADIVLKPWGYYEVLFREQSNISNFPTKVVKKLVIKQDESLSSQVHLLRDEYWTFVSGAALIKLRDYFSKQDTFTAIFRTPTFLFIPRRTIHAITALEETIIMEGQFGVCDEDDIIRYYDKYGRV